MYEYVPEIQMYEYKYVHIYVSRSHINQPLGNSHRCVA